MKKIREFFKKATSSIIAAAMLLTLSVPPNISIAEELNEPQGTIEETTEETTDTSTEELSNETSEETSEEILGDSSNEVNAEDENTSETSEEQTEVTSEETTEDESINNANEEKVIGNNNDTKLFVIKNETGRNIISFNIIENEQTSTSNMLQDVFEANEERTVYFNYVADKDYDLVLKMADGSEITVYSFDIKDMSSNVTNPDNKVLLKLDSESQTTYLKYGTKQTLDEEKLLSEENGIVSNASEGEETTQEPNDEPISDTNRIVTVDTSLNDEEFYNRYGLTKEEYNALVNASVPTVNTPLASSSSDEEELEELIEEEHLLGAGNGTYSVESMDTPSLWGTVGMIAQMQDSSGNLYPDGTTHALCINHQLSTDYGNSGVTYTKSSYADYGIPTATGRLLAEMYYYTYGSGQGATAQQFGLNENGVHALGSYTASYLVNGSASVGSTIAGHCADFVSWLQSNNYEFRLADDNANDNLSNSAQTNISTVSTDADTEGMFKSNPMTFTTTGDMVYYTIAPANCKVGVTYSDGSTGLAVSGQQIYINNNAVLTLYAASSLAETTTTLTFQVINEPAYIPHSLYIFTPSNGAKQPLFAPQWSFPYMNASVSWAGKGNILVRKGSQKPAVTDGNSDYSLQGAVYTVYPTRTDAENGTNAITTITTDASGEGTSIDLDYATYYVKETTASRGYTLDKNIYEKTVSATDTQPVVNSSEPLPPYVVVKKQTSATCTELVANNSNYSLAGAKFKMYRDASCTQALTSNAYDFITDANGNTTPVDVTNYMPASETASLWVYIREEEASKGYLRNDTAERVEIKWSNDISNPATVTIDEKAKGDPAEVMVYKKGSTKQKPVSGAIFEVKFYAAESDGQLNDTTYRRHWYLKTNANGYANLNSRFLTEYNDNTSDAFYYVDGIVTLPLGYITVQEVYAPTGYILDNTIHTYPTTDTNTNTSVENERTVTNDEWSKPFELTKLGNDGVSVLAPLPNAGFMIWNIENLETDAEGEYIFDESKAEVLTTTGEKEIFTDTNGKAKTIPLVYGSYIVKETTTPPDYLPCADFSISVLVNDPDNAEQLYIVDNPIHYYLRIVKRDITTGKAILNKKSTYKIYSYATDDFVSFRSYDGSTPVMQSEFTTNDESILILPEPLKSGRYKIYETVGPDGYNVDSPEGIDFSIDGNTAYETYEIPGDTAAIGLVTVYVTDTPIYGRYEIEKTGGIRTYDETTGEFVVEDVPLEDIDFGIFAAEDIYTSDGTDTLIYSKGDLAFTITTDADGKASQDNIPLGKYTVKELNTPDDFVAVKDTDIEFKLTDKKQDANGKYYVEQKSEFYNAPYFPKVGTTALDSKTEEHTGVVGEEVTIVDKVDCSDLVIGRVYTIRGKLYDTKTKEVYLDNDGEEVKATKTFTATSKDMTVDLEFTYSSTDLAGETIVVFETLYYNDKIVALHTDITDENQQVHYPDVKTTALDGKTNTHTGVVDEKVTVVDKVACTNLIIGKEYTIKGKLYNTKTGGAILENGKEVTAEVTFKAEEVNPTIDLTFTLNSKTLAGETIVVFEDLYHKDIKVATHSDLEDENQQVSYPTVGTKAVDKDTDSKSGVTGEVATIVDTVDCKNLVIGQVYTVKGKLYDTKSGEVFLDNGKEVTAEKTFVAIKKDMTVELTFTFNSTSLEGKTTTVFEDLYTENIKVASHSDINDKEQQVDYPQVKTTAKDKATDTHTGVKSETATIIDTVECTNLIVGKEYTVKGKLYNTETGEVFLDNGKEVTAEKTFTADKKDMTVELSFTFNSMSLEGETIVVFEDLYHKNIKVDSHARLDDKEQQVHYPKIGTTAKNPVDGGKVAKPNKSVKLNDTVDVKSVGVGDKFILKGVIYDKATGEKLLINGEEVWSEATLTAPDKNFKTDVIFTFDASSLAGKNIVVFEYMYLVKADGTEVLVASHEDINDEGQSIKFSTEPKTGDRGFADVFIIFILSLMGIVALYLAKRKVLR